MWDWNEGLGEMNCYPRISKKEYPKQRVVPERPESGADPGHLRHGKGWWMELEWNGQTGKEKPSYAWPCRNLSGYQCCFPVPWDMHDLKWKKTKLWLAFQKHYTLVCEEKGWGKKDTRILLMWESMMTWDRTRALLIAVSLPALCCFAVQPPTSQQTTLIPYYSDYFLGMA